MSASPEPTILKGLPAGAGRALRLTSEQAAAAHAGPDGAFLIAAGPGTGKTLTMVRRVRWLLEERGLRPEQVLAVTFGEAAAAELRERLSHELDRPLEDAWIGTFHGVCARLLREEAYLVGISREVRVLDELGQRLMVERLQAQLRSGAEPGLDRDFEALNPDEVTDLVKSGPTFALKLKGRGVMPDEFRARAHEIHRSLLNGRQANPAGTAELEAIDVLHVIYAAYQRRLREAGRVDFDDLILTVIDALREVPEFRRRCRERFRQIVVDEFQDTNRIQLELIRLLAAPDFGNVTVVGDAKQSIYGWRDAEIENIRSRFPGRPLPLTLNRRSRQEILDCATAFIRRDPDFAGEPDLRAARGSGGPCVTVVLAGEAREEAGLVAAEIRRLHAAGRPWSEVAILTYSVRQLPREFEDELRRQGIPYVTSGGSGFFDREEVKDVLALLRLVADPMDDGALVRLLQNPVVRLDDAAMYALGCRRLGRRGMRLRDCVEESRAEGWPELPPGAAGRVERALAVVDQIGEARDGLTVADVLNRLLEQTGYLRHAQLRARREGPRAVLNVRQVFRMASRFERDTALAGIGDFVAHLDRIMEMAVPVGEAEVAAADAVRLLTVHGAKGLEFGAVFVVNVKRPNPRDTEKLFFEPDHFGFVMKYWRSNKHPRFKEIAPGAAALTLARQERRRAVYVALTRARDALYVSASRPDAEQRQAVEIEDDDHFAELLAWAVDHPEAARVVRAEQLELPVPATGEAVQAGAEQVDVEAVIGRLEALRALPVGPPPGEALPALRLSFSQLHTFQVCPVRYRYQEAWRVPAPPDELLPRPARRAGGAELGASVHEALAAYHGSGADPLAAYAGPPLGRELLLSYLDHPLARAPSLGAEVEFTLRLAGPQGEVRVNGVVDRVCELEGRLTLVDYKTNARLDAALREAYASQLRLYGLAARRGLLPGAEPGCRPRLLLFDLRHAEAIEVDDDPGAAESAVLEAAARIRSGDFGLRAEHAARPCFLCAYRPLCPSRR